MRNPSFIRKQAKLSKKFSIIALIGLVIGIIAIGAFCALQMLNRPKEPAQGMESSAYFVYQGKKKGPYKLPAAGDSPEEIIIHLGHIKNANQPYLSISILEVLEDADNFIPERFFNASFDGTPIMPYSEKLPENGDVKWELRWQLVPEWKLVKIRQTLKMKIRVDLKYEKEIPFPNQGVFPKFEDKEAPIGNIDYYYRGAYQSTYSIPMERCSRNNDYMLIHLINSAKMKEPLMGLRVTYIFEGESDPTVPPVIHATHEDRLIPSTVESLDPDSGGIWLVSWRLDPSWRSIKVTPELEMRFQLVVQDSSFDWSVFGTRKKTLPGAKADEPCWP